MARLAVPIVLAELGWMSMGVVDTMVVGRVGAEALAAASLGAMVFYGIGISASGLLLGLDTLVSQSFGAGNREDCRRSLVNGVWLSAVLVPVIMGLVWILIPLLDRLGVDAGVLKAGRPYMYALNWSTPFLMLYFCFRRYLQAIGIVRPITWALITANVVNLAGNWIFVFGNLGAPRLGLAGSGWATCVSRIFMAAVLGLVVWRHHRRDSRISWAPDLHRMRELLRLGVPAAGQLGAEIGVFCLVTVLVARLNAVSLAVHQIALITVSTTYMMPLGISSAAAVRVGQGIGRRDPRAAARSGWTAIGLGAAVMSASALMLLTLPHWIARLFTPETKVIAGAVTLLRIAAFFQLFDGLQVVATGALRGAGDTRTPMIFHLIGYWIIGVPVGAALCFWKGWGVAGLWTGLSAGLIVIGIALAGFWYGTALRLKRG